MLTTHHARFQEHWEDGVSKSFLSLSLTVNEKVSSVITVCIKDAWMKDAIWKQSYGMYKVCLECIQPSNMKSRGIYSWGLFFPHRPHKSITDSSFMNSNRSVNFQKHQKKCLLKALGLAGLRKILQLGSSEILASTCCGSEISSHSEGNVGREWVVFRIWKVPQAVSVCFWTLPWTC